MICSVFLGVYWCVCSFICLLVGGFKTTDIKLHNLRVSSSSVGRVSARVCKYWYDLSVGGHETT